MYFDQLVEKEKDYSFVIVSLNFIKSNVRERHKFTIFNVASYSKVTEKLNYLKRTLN